MLGILTGYLGFATLHFAAFAALSLRKPAPRRPGEWTPRVGLHWLSA